ncbi:DHRSX [Symbiodinium pilosum]|uniref:DHRSX protein n=1 Tax=Symbiodinium pilosum TaxID=2952 RepID=A0A812VG71_SYMPI|nr:DHRSX [Symbiodinium pilosum]
MARVCSQPLSLLQSLAEWAQYVVQGTARCAGGGGSEVSSSRVIWDALVPQYHPTTVASLEERRENLSLALMGQLSVFFCRLLTGHWGACGIGLIIFVVGNNARCSLQVSELTCYVALSGCAGGLDALDFLQRLLQGNYITLAFPFAQNLALNLEVFSVWMAPVAEILGARTAWGCYLNPSMLFETPCPQMMSMQSQYGQPIFHPGQMAPQLFRSMPSRPPDPMRTRMPGGVWGDMASMMPGWPGAMDAERVVAFGSGSTDEQMQQTRVQIHGLDSEGYSSSSRDRPHVPSLHIREFIPPSVETIPTLSAISVQRMCQQEKVGSDWIEGSAWSIYVDFYGAMRPCWTILLLFATFTALAGSVKNTCAAILAAQQLKKTKAEILNAADSGHPCPGTQKIEPYSKFHLWSSGDRMLFLVPVAQTDFKQLLKSTSAEDIVNYSLHTARRLWCWVDRTSREMGRIMKYEVVCDFSGFSFRYYIHCPWDRPLSQAYPICCGDRQKQSPASCPYLQRHFADAQDIQSLSSLLSGACPVSGHVADIEPNWTEKEFVDFEANVAAIDPAGNAAAKADGLMKLGRMLERHQGCPKAGEISRSSVRTATRFDPELTGPWVKKKRAAVVATVAAAATGLAASWWSTPTTLAMAGQSTPPLQERIFMVTGATDGIGKFTAEQLAKLGSTVIVHGRNPRKIEATIAELQRLAPTATLHGVQADLSLMSEVRRLGEEVSEKFPRIHGLLNNAGTFDGDYTGKRVETAEGNEYSLAVNVMAPFLLTSLLMETVKATGSGRIIVTSSVSKGSGDALNDLQLKSGWSGHRAYSLSKLCDAMMIVEMNRRYGDAPRLCFHTMDPGTVDTKMLRAGWWSGGSSVRTATKSFRMLTEDSYQERSGQSLGGSEISDDGKRSKLWEDLVSLTGADWPAVK